MSLRHLGLAVIGALATPAVLAAQLPRTPMSQNNKVPHKDAKQVMITAFKGPPPAPAEKGKWLGVQAAEEMRKEVESAFADRELFVIPVERIVQQLEPSGFSPNEGLALHDSKTLAVTLRADEFISAQVARTPSGGYRAEADLVLTRDVSARQPLGVGEAPKLGDAIKILVKEMQAARKQLPGEKNCSNAAREGKYPLAIEYANAAITAYPKATLARMCLVSVQHLSKAPTAEVAKTARELAALDPRSNYPLKYLVEVYRAEKQPDSLLTVYMQMLRNEPTNTDIARDIVNEVAKADPAKALPIIDEVINLNPGDPDLMKSRWLILRATKDYKRMFEAGKEILRLDAAFADTTYFAYTATAFASDSQWQPAAAAAAEGVAKFPTNAFLVGLEIEYLQKAGQFQQALDKVNKAVAGKISVPNLGARKLLILTEMKASPSDVIAAAREAIAAGDTTTAVRQVMLQQINLQFAAAQELQKTDAPQAIANLTSMLGTLAYADSVVTGADLQGNVAFFRGASQFVMATIKIRLAQEQRSCAMVKEAEAILSDAMISLPRGAKFAPAAMQQMMNTAMQLGPQLAQLKASITGCR